MTTHNMKHMVYILMLLASAFSNDASLSWYELKISICAVCEKSYYDGKKFIMENKTILNQAQTHLLIIMYYGIRMTKSFPEK